MLAFVIGGAISQRHLTQAEMGNGQSGQALRTYTDAFPKQASEQVLVQGRGSVRVGSPAFAAAVNDLVARLGTVRYVSDVRSPLGRGNRAQISSDGRSALVMFKVAGDEAQVQTASRRAARGDRGDPAGASTAEGRGVRRRERG